MRALTLLALPAVVLLATVAGAQERSADDLFQEATQLFARGETKAACDKFAASYKLDASPGTLFNMAVCHEKDSRLWQARAEFLDFADRAIKVHKPEAAQPALQHLTSIEAHLPRVQLAFPDRANVTSILVDGAALEPEAWKKPFPVDGARSDHAIEFRGAGGASETRKVTTGAEGSVTKVDVPALAAGAGGAVDTGGGGAAVVSPAPVAAGHADHTVAYVVGGAGVVALAVGGVFGGLTFSEKGSAQNACTGGSASNHTCSSVTAANNAQSAHTTAETYSWVSTIGLGVGVVAVGVGVALLFAGGKEAPPPSSVGLHLVPTMGPNGGGAVLSGAF
jgi:hypothetical protein